MAEFIATVLAKLGANLVESLVLKLAQAWFTRAFTPATA